MNTQNFDYYQLRAEEELAAARLCREAGIAQIHHDLAQRYRDLAAGNSSGAAINEPGPAFGC